MDDNAARTPIAPTRLPRRSTGPFGPVTIACALTLGCGPLMAATAGLPFSEDFTDDDLIDPSATTAAWVASRQAVQLIERSTWNQPVRNRAFYPPSNEVNSLPMNGEVAPTTDVALGDVNHDGNLDMVVVNDPSTADYSNRICLGDGTGVTSCSNYDLGAGFDHIPRAVLLVDVNHDGHLDIIEGRDGGQNRLNLGHGNGTFAAGTTIGDETDATRDLQVADLDRDGNPDLVVANRGETNKVYFGDGAGGFSATGTDIGSETERTVSIALGDLDRDGDIDIVASNGSVKRIYLNDGSGGFGASGTDIGLDSDRTSRLALADFTSDGVPDLVLANSDASQKIYPGDGNGGFTDTGLSFAGSRSSSVGIDDFNGDGHLDIVFGDGSAKGMYLGDGAGGFSSKGSTFDFELSDTVSVAIGDVDNDGSPDIVLPQGFTTSLPNHVYLNSPGTGFDPQGLDLIPGVETTTSALKLADIDGDGDLDVVTGRFGDSDAVYINEFDGEFVLFKSSTFNAAFFSGPLPIASSGTHTTALDLGDLDGDGILDLVTADINGPKKIFFGNGTGGFVYQDDIATDDFDSTQGIRFGDVDGDGDLDILLANLDNFDSLNRLYLNDGAGGFPATGIPIGDESEDSYAIAFGDVDGDGTPDIVVGNDGSAPNRLHLGNGDGGFSASGTAIGTTHYNTRAIELVDFDGDGDLDVIAGNRGDPDRVYLHDGGGDFPGNGNALLASRHGDTLEVLIDDVNNDAILDVVAVETNSIALYLGDGDGGVGHTVGLGFGANTAQGAGALGDLDRDGDLDLVTGANNEQDYIYFNEFDGGGFDGLALPIGSGTNASRSAVWIDANGDHWPDLAVANDGDVNRLYPGTADGPSGSGSAIGFESDSSQAFAQADFNHDGAMDLVVANVGDQNRLYLGDGNGGFSGSGIAVGLGVDNSRAIAVGDIDRDGHPDVVVGNDGQPNRLYLGDGTGGFSETGSAIGTELDATWSIALADVDVDGWLDVVAGNAGQTNRLYTNDGAGDFHNGAAIGAASDTTRDVTVADLDDDGKPDLVTANDGQPNRYYLGNGAGGFAAGVDLGAESEASHAIALADIGNDGDYDVIVGNLGEANRLYLNNGALDFGSVVFDAAADADQTRGVLAGDGDRDGDVDVFSFNDNQTNRQLVQSGYLAHANTVTSEKINDTEVAITELRLTATALDAQDTRYFLSNDGGATWHRVESGADFTFPSAGDDVRWRAELVGGNRVMVPNLLTIDIADPDSIDDGDGADSGSGSSGDGGGSGGGGGGGGGAVSWLWLWLCVLVAALRRGWPRIFPITPHTGCHAADPRSD